MSEGLNDSSSCLVLTVASHSQLAAMYETIKNLFVCYNFRVLLLFEGLNLDISRLLAEYLQNVRLQPMRQS
jgi:hypothetical protein